MKRTLVKVHESVNSIIPKGVLEHFGLEVGDKLDFRIDGDHIKAIPVHANRQVENVQAATNQAVTQGEGNE